MPRRWHVEASNGYAGVAARETGAVLTLEEHSVTGGLGGAVAEVLAEWGELRVPFKRIGLASIFSSQVGSQEYLREQYGISTEGILRTIDACLKSFRNTPWLRAVSGT